MRFVGLRFVVPETERTYRRWRDGNAMAFSRIGYIGSTPSWVLLMTAAFLLDPDAAAEAAVWVIGWIVLLMVLTGLTFLTTLRRAVMPLAAVANCLAGVLIVWVLSHVVLRDQLVQTRVGVMTAGLIVVMFFGFAIFRIPPGIAAAAITPYAAFGSYQLWSAWERGDLNGVEAGSLAAAQWIAYFGCLLVCTVIEIVSRRTFCKDQVIETQQQELRVSREAIRRYAPGAVAEHILAGDIDGVGVPVRRRVTVLFADLVGFTTLADRVEAEVLTQVINDYMTSMSDVVDEHGSTVNEFAGDGLMAIFGAPDDLTPEEQAERAVHAALAMQARLPSLDELWHRLGVSDPLAMRIGINTGVLSVGSFGSEGRMTYTAIGMQTNIAARLQAACDPGQVLLSESTWALVEGRVACEPRGAVICKGVHYPVRVYTPRTSPHGAVRDDAQATV